MSETTIVQKSQEEIRRELAEGKDRTDWERLEKLTDADIEAAVRDDPDAVLLDEEWVQAARAVRPSGEKEQISIRLDKDVLDHFRAEGGGYQTRINNVLRAYVLVCRMQEQEDARRRDE